MIIPTLPPPCLNASSGQMQECQYFMKSGFCKYGARCVHNHPLERAQEAFEKQRGRAPPPPAKVDGARQSAAAAADPIALPMPPASELRQPPPPRSSQERRDGMAVAGRGGPTSTAAASIASSLGGGSRIQAAPPPPPLRAPVPPEVPILMLTLPNGQRYIDVGGRKHPVRPGMKPCTNLMGPTGMCR